MYENFNASSSESLDSIFTRLQKIVSQLAILGENISQEDLNFKFLRSLPSEWSMHVVVWRNKSDLGSISFDDLYNNFKIVEQEVKRSVISSSNSSSQNVAFVSTPSSTNDVNTSNVHVSTASSSLSTASSTDNTARLSDATIYAFLANQPNGSQVVHEDLEQIHEDDLEEMDLKWQLALLSMKARKFYQRTGKKIIINGNETAGYDKTKVECFNCHKMGHFVRECKNPRTIDGVGFDWSFMTEEKTPTNFALMAFSDLELNKSEFDLANYKRGLAFVEEQLVFYKKNEGMLCDQIAVLKRDASFNESEINALKIQIERLKKEKESNQFKIDNFENASKSLFAPPTIDLSNSSLEEFKQPEFKGYGVKVSDCDEDETLEKVSESANVNSINTAKGKRVTSAIGEQGINAIKSKACWVWRPKLKTKGVKHIGKSKAVGTLRYLSLVVPLTKVGDEAVHKELGDRMERAATAASSFKAEQDSGGYTPGSDKGSKKLNELTELCIKLSEKGQTFRRSAQVYNKEEKGTKFEDKLNDKEMKKVIAREGSRKYWKIIRVRDVTVAYQSFEDMLKGFNKEDLVALRSLVKERFRFVESTEDMEKAL
ncbi:ribonuclease H-like domain-containing protein [Tanacetum coccineum]